jgi:asparagine synthetase B (glutamine-hydrolysing)
MNNLSTDWLASSPVFYNEKTKTASKNINDVIDISNLEFDMEGLKLFLDFGYCVFERTPVKNVKFLPPNSSIETADKNLKIYSEDDELNFPQLLEEEVVELIRNKIEKWEESFSGDILIPTSGGFDSRMLNVLVKDKKRILSCTYGISRNQMSSREIVYARKLSKILGTRWMPVQLGDFHNYLQEWNSLYGIATHAHGMYHIEFFRKIASKNNITHLPSVLSGILGDAWAGNVNISEINSPDQIWKLGYTHGVHADSEQLLFKPKSTPIEEFFEKEKDNMKDERYRIILMARKKIILLSMLLRVPELLGMKAWSPFVDKEVVLAMLNLPQQRRTDRKWQVDFFRKNNVYIEDLKMSWSRQNILDYKGLRNVPLKPLDVNKLKELFKQEYIEWINRKLSQAGLWSDFYQSMFTMRYVKEGLKKLGIKNDLMNAYHAYLTIYPIEQLLIRRDNER